MEIAPFRDADLLPLGGTHTLWLIGPTSTERRDVSTTVEKAQFGHTMDFSNERDALQPITAVDHASGAPI
jgi:hypothetical protein